MKKLNFFVIALALIFSSNLFAQDMMPPKPIDSPLLNSMVGTWVSEPYKMMGSTMTDEVTHSMILNGQFFQVKVKSTSDNGFVYEGLVIMAPSSDGSMTGTGYDVFGKDAITSYTGTTDGQTIYLTGLSNWGKELRNITMDGNVMTQNVVFNMKSPDGKEMPEEKMTISYNKK